jgi:hypothetical protein
MTHHFTRSTVEASAWCKKCQKSTMHRVDQDVMQGRLGPCLLCMEKLEKLHNASKPEPDRQGSLFCV